MWSLQLHNACLECFGGQFLSNSTINEFCRNAAGYRVIIPVGDLNGDILMTRYQLLIPNVTSKDQIPALDIG